jgi:hypothetical protein
MRRTPESLARDQELRRFEELLSTSRELIAESEELLSACREVVARSRELRAVSSDLFSKMAMRRRISPLEATLAVGVRPPASDPRLGAGATAGFESAAE